MKNHSTHRLAAMIALTALFFIPLRAAAQTNVSAWTTNEGTTFWARLVGWNGADLILMVRDRDFRMPVSRLSAESVGKAGRMLGLPEGRLTGTGTPGKKDTVEPPQSAPRRPETAKPLAYGEFYSSLQAKCKAAALVTADQNSCVRPPDGATCPQARHEPAVMESPAPAKPQDDAANGPGGPDLGLEVVAFCKEHLGMKVGNGQCSTLAAEALRSAGAARTGRDFPRRGDYVWGEQVALLEHGRREIAGLESLAKVRPGDIIQFRDVRISGPGPGGVGTCGMTAEHHTAVVATVDPAGAVVTYYHQNWGRMIVKQDRMQLEDMKSGWMRIYRPVAAE